jgi:DNA-binding response OmpR family regulator
MSAARHLRAARRRSSQPATASDIRPAVTPTLVLFSVDKELTSLVRNCTPAPWCVELCENLAVGRDALSRPSVRLVIVDDGAVDEDAREWLLDRIRKFVPQALLIYIASAHTEADEKRARGYSAQYYTAKPLDMDRTARVIESFARNAGRLAG